MTISSVSALASIYSGYYSIAANTVGSSSAGSTSVTKTADGATVTTQRGSAGGIISVSTSAPASASTVPQVAESSVDITA